MSKPPSKTRCEGCKQPLDTYTLQVSDKFFHNAECYRLYVEAEAKGTKRFNANEVK